MAGSVGSRLCGTERYSRIYVPVDAVEKLISAGRVGVWRSEDEKVTIFGGLLSWRSLGSLDELGPLSNTRIKWIQEDDVRVQ